MHHHPLLGVPGNVHCQSTLVRVIRYIVTRLHVGMIHHLDLNPHFIHGIGCCLKSKLRCLFYLFKIHESLCLRKNHRLRTYVLCWGSPNPLKSPGKQVIIELSANVHEGGLWVHFDQHLELSWTCGGPVWMFKSATMWCDALPWFINWPIVIKLII